MKIEQKKINNPVLIIIYKNIFKIIYKKMKYKKKKNLNYHLIILIVLVF